MKHIVGIPCHQLAVLTLVGISLVCGGVQAQTSSRIYYYHGQSDHRADNRPDSRSGREGTLVRAAKETDRGIDSNGIVVSRGSVDAHGGMSSSRQSIVRRAGVVDTRNGSKGQLHPASGLRPDQQFAVGAPDYHGVSYWLQRRYRSAGKRDRSGMLSSSSVDESSAESTNELPRIVLSTGTRRSELSADQAAESEVDPAQSTDLRDTDSWNAKTKNSDSRDVDARSAGFEGNTRESGTGEAAGAVNRETHAAHGIERDRKSTRLNSSH